LIVVTGLDTWVDGPRERVRYFRVSESRKNSLARTLNPLRLSGVVLLMPLLWRPANGRHSHHSEIYT